MLILTNGEQNLWAGVGITPGTAEDMYSSQAEAFSVLAGLFFFNYYTACFPKTNDTHAQLQCFCDNLGIITNVTEMHKAMIQWLNDMTANDYDVYIAICQAAETCKHIQMSFNHVKGYQDKDPNRPLTYVKQLNVDCDCRAKWYTTSVQQSSTTYGNPMIPMAQPHLIIGNRTIYRNVFTALWQAASLPPYCKDMQKKHQWTMHNFNNIDWNTVKLALSSFQLEDQWRIILFIHKKLPLWASKAHPHHSSKLCPPAHAYQKMPNTCWNAVTLNERSCFLILKTSLPCTCKRPNSIPASSWQSGWV